MFDVKTMHCTTNQEYKTVITEDLYLMFGIKLVHHFILVPECPTLIALNVLQLAQYLKNYHK